MITEFTNETYCVGFSGDDLNALDAIAIERGTRRLDVIRYLLNSYCVLRDVVRYPKCNPATPALDDYQTTASYSFGEDKS